MSRVVLPTSQMAFRVTWGPQRRGPTLGRRSMTTDKLTVLVRVDLDGAWARVAAQGHVTTQSVQGLYPVMKRANSLVAGLTLEIDLTRAQTEPDALELLNACSRSHHLPAEVDPNQSEYRINILAPEDAPAGLVLTQAA